MKDLTDLSEVLLRMTEVSVGSLVESEVDAVRLRVLVSGQTVGIQQVSVKR